MEYNRISDIPTNQRLLPETAISGKTAGIYYNANDDSPVPYVVIVNPPGGFHHGHDNKFQTYLGIGSQGCGPIEGSLLGAWEPVPKGMKIVAEWTA